MVIVKAREIVRNMVSTGRYRLSVEWDVDGTAPEPLCACPGGHVSMEKARQCPEAQVAAQEALAKESLVSGLAETEQAAAVRAMDGLRSATLASGRRED